MTQLVGHAFSPLREGNLRLYRGSSNGPASVLLIVVEDSCPADVKLLEQEFALRAELDPAWAARPLSLSHRSDRWELLLEDPGGEPLERLLRQPLEIPTFLAIAIQLARVLRQVHERGLIHRDIKPGNILVDTATQSLKLTGFGIALRPTQDAEPPHAIAGTLAYMAPEQTGRINRSIDARSDLYSSGVTFYEMLTGMVPFTAHDSVEWVHCHIAKQPVAPSERLASVPPQLSAIVMKLLSKSPDDRYQTAAGLELDLLKCLSEWDSRGRIEPFPLGLSEVPDKLLFPGRLYGREREIETLRAAFSRVAATATSELVLISGYSGIGKSSVVSQLYQALVPGHSLFAEGKFDGYKREIPYAPLAQAFQGLLLPLLGRNEVAITPWRDAFREALDPNGQLMVNLVPELELIIGTQTAAESVPPQDATNRFRFVFQRFLQVFATKEHPLVLFLDDLQWLDEATLDLLCYLLRQTDLQYLLLIGAYRDNEIGAAHPLRRMTEAIRSSGTKILEMALTPLRLEEISQLVSDSLRCKPDRAGPLVQLVHEKTGGNPLFAIGFLTGLVTEGLLSFDRHAAGWTWNLARLRAKGYSDNVVELMIDKLKRLSSTTQEALKQLAYLGNVVDLPTIARVSGKSEEKIHTALREATRAGLVLRKVGSYVFLHDRVQEAAYALIPTGERAAAHLRIGRILTSQTRPQDLEERIFEIVSQFERGAALIDSWDERERVAKLYLVAGKRAKLAMANAAALKYLTAGRAMLREDAWERQYELTFSLEYHRAECELLTTDVMAAQERLKELARRARNLTDVTAVTCLRMMLHTTMDRSDLGIEVCLEYLRGRGVLWSAHPTREEVLQEYERIWQQIGSRAIEDLLDLPSMEDPVALATVEVLTEAMAPALFTDKNLLSLVICRMTNLSLEHGNSDGSCVAYVWLGTILGSHFEDHRAGLTFGRVGYDLVERRGLLRYQARAYTSFGNLVMIWTHDRQNGRALTRRGFEVANRMGDFTYAAYSCSNLCANYLAAGDPLPVVQAEIEKALEFARRIGFGLASDVFMGLLGLVRNLRGMTAEFGSLDNESFRESEFELHLQSDPHLALPECWYWIRVLQARVYANEYSGAIEAGAKAQRLLWTSLSFFEAAEFHFYDALARAGRYDAASADEQRQHIEALRAHRERLESLAETCFENFGSRAALVSGELARIEGRTLEALGCYEHAIRLSREQGFAQVEGLALEVSARFHLALGLETIGQVFLRYARNTYEQWGARGKVEQLQRLHPSVREPVGSSASIRTIDAPVIGLDVETVVKASQALSSEIDLARLIETLMRIAVEHAGAERALLVLVHREGPSIEAEAITGEDGINVTRRQATVTAAELPETILHYVLRTRKSVILSDAATTSHPFSSDVYLRQTRTRSVLCLPLIKQATLTGALYLENRLTPHVFTSARLGVLNLLASQAAISLENAQLYADLRLENSVRKRAEDGLRRSDAYLAEAQRLSHTGSFGWNPATGETYWSEECFRIFELDCAATPSVATLALERVHPDDIAAFRETIRRASDEGRDFACEHRLRMPDGRVKHLHVVAHAVRNESGGLEFVGAVKDISDLTWAQEERRRLEQRLQQAEKMEAIGRLASGIAHDFSNVLAGVFAYGEMLFDEAPAASPLKRYAQNVLTAASHGRELIDQILTYSGSHRSELAPVDLVRIVTDTLEILRGSLRSDIHIQWNAPDFPIVVISNPSRLHRVVMNVCVNAVQAIGASGSVLVSLEPVDFVQDKVLSVGTLTPGHYAQLAVQDTGVGMDETTLSRIFEPFFTTKPVGQGTGLGLSLVYAIIKDSGGAIDVRSIPRQGTAFTIYLPLPHRGDLRETPPG